MRKHFIILLAFLLLLSLCAPALATEDPEEAAAPLVNEDGTIVEEEAPNMFLSYMLGIALFAIIAFSIWIKVKAIQSGAGGRKGWGA